MNFREEKGITGIDITVSIIIITLFIGIIATLLFNINSSSGGIGRKTEATNYAITEIEKIKAMDFASLNNTEESGYIENTPYYKEVSVLDYADFPENEGKDKVHGLVKKISVIISYKNGKNTEKVELATVITKE